MWNKQIVQKKICPERNEVTKQFTTLHSDKFCDVCKLRNAEGKGRTSVRYVSETVLIPTITVRPPYVDKLDILRRAENIDQPVAFEPLMKPSVLQIAFMYRQAFTKCLKLQGPWCRFHKAWSQSTPWETAGIKWLLWKKGLIAHFNLRVWKVKQVMTPIVHFLSYQVLSTLEFRCVRLFC
jgi:hypothetical protein